MTATLSSAPLTFLSFFFFKDDKIGDKSLSDLAPQAAV